MKRQRGLGLIFQRGAIFWIQYNVRGKRYRESSGSTNRADAVRMLKQRIADVQTGKPVGSQIERTTLGDIIAMVEDDYRANRRQLRGIESPIIHLIRHFGKECPAINVTADVVTQYRATRLETGAANASINRSLAVLKRAFKLAAIAGKVAHQPYIAMLTEDNARQGFVTPSEFERLREALPVDLRDPVEFLYRSAWRVGEMRSLEWRDVKDGAIRLRPENSKTKHGRVLPLRAELAAIIERAHERRIPELPFVFHRDDGSPIGLFRKSWAAACRKAGLERFWSTTSGEAVSRT
jgi:integrase